MLSMKDQLKMMNNVLFYFTNPAKHDWLVGMELSQDIQLEFAEGEVYKGPVFSIGCLLIRIDFLINKEK